METDVAKEQQGIRFDADSLARGNGLTAHEAITLLMEHLRYAGLVTEEGDGKYVAWLPVGRDAGGPAERVRSFGQFAERVVREV